LPKVSTRKCPICLLVLRKPSQVECCGRVFCTGCLQRALRDSDDRCPMCNARAPRMFTDQNFRRILAGFRVYCVHRSRGEGERGCQWTGELRQLGSHLNPNQNQKGCLFVNVTCSLCGETMKRSSLSQHQESDCPKRSYSCPHCYIQSNYNNIVNSHLGKCPYYPCRCPHCDLMTERCE
ncbi:TNF receptor-associated factor 6, partial [Geodia barretti]